MTRMTRIRTSTYNLNLSELSHSWWVTVYCYPSDVIDFAKLSSQILLARNTFIVDVVWPSSNQNMTARVLLENSSFII